MDIELTINGKRRRFDVEANRLLLNLLRDKLYLTGTKCGCGIGECGACTVHLNGEAVLSCMMLAVDADGGRVDTIEGMADGDKRIPSRRHTLRRGRSSVASVPPASS